MPRRRSDEVIPRQALTPEGRMQKLTKKAFDLAEKQLADGTCLLYTSDAADE